MNRRKFLLGVSTVGVASALPISLVMPIEAAAKHPFLVWVSKYTSDRFVALELIRQVVVISGKSSPVKFICNITGDDHDSKFMDWLREITDDPKYLEHKYDDHRHQWVADLKANVKPTAEYAAQKFFHNWSDLNAQLHLDNSKNT